MTVNLQSSQPSSSTQLPSQPLPNPKGSINVVQTNEAGETEEDEDEEDEEEEDDDEWLYELLVKLARESSNSKEEGEEAEVDEVANAVETSSQDKEEEYFIATVYGGIEAIPEELPEKCADPGPCFVTCRIGKEEVSDHLCDSGECASVMPLELYKTLQLGPLKKTLNKSARWLAMDLHPWLRERPRFMPLQRKPRDAYAS
ncbi:hypothetical protein PIB30_097560 [Stylosanthes scabra]|uniref:Uncharacterized protein n=1 Tax=Stylosanthes scabra TaxID=79078 RepID=A0ABU6WVY0_9FABA|nr:hypothetical protein [Stylosanthes scabra]